jgi:hypothetical protein
MEASMSQPSLPPTSVDVSHLDQAAYVLEDIKRFIETYCLGQMHTVSQSLGTPTNVHDDSAEYSFTRRATFFGGFRSAYGLQERNDSAYRAVQTSLKELVERLTQAADATRTIAQNYRTVEERNKAMGEDIERALSNYQITPPGSGPSAIA